MLVKSKTLGLVLFITVLAAMSLSQDVHSVQRSEVCKDVPEFTREQAATLEDAYEIGRPYNLQYVMMAIAVKESTAGKFRMNIKSDDYGVFGIKLKYAMIRGGKKGEFSRNMLAQSLVLDNEVAGYHAIETIKELKNYHRWDIRKLLEHYKDGKKVTNKGRQYAKDALQLINQFKTCGVVVKI